MIGPDHRCTFPAVVKCGDLFPRLTARLEPSCLLLLRGGEVTGLERCGRAMHSGREQVSRRWNTAAYALRYSEVVPSSNVQFGFRLGRLHSISNMGRSAA